MRALVLCVAVACASDKPLRPHSRTTPDETSSARRTDCSADPIALIQAAYAPYLADELPGRLAHATCWTLDTFHLIDRSAQETAAAGTTLLGFDPIIDAQDADLAHFHIREASPGSFRVAFENYGRQSSVMWALKQEDDAWRTHNLWGDGWELRKALAEPE